MTNGGLWVAYIHPGSVDGMFHESMMHLMAADAAKGDDGLILKRGGHIGKSSGPRIAAARNDVVRHFLGFRSDWLLMIDSDMVFTPEDVYDLVETADAELRPIVGGLCFGGGKSGMMFPTLYRLVDEENPVQIIKDYPPDRLCEVDATGAAFLLVHRSVLEKMHQTYGEPIPWFAEGTLYKGYQFGEDWAFCMRAKQLGYPIYVHTGIRIGHMKSQIMDEDAYKTYRAKEKRLGENGMQAEHRRRLGVGTRRQRAKGRR